MRIVCCLPLIFALLSTPSLAAAPTAADVVSSFHQTLIDNMHGAESLGCAGRIKHLQTAVDASYDLRFIAEHILRRHWATLSAAQQAEFIATLREMVVTTYASQFSHFNGEKFVTLETQEIATDRRVVHAQLELKSGDPVRFDYVLHQTPDGWRTINVIAEGVSDLALRSAQYDHVIKEKGFDGLLTMIREQTAKIMSGC